MRYHLLSGDGSGLKSWFLHFGATFFIFSKRLSALRKTANGKSVSAPIFENFGFYFFNSNEPA
jgi:hypothetical protein